jgi:hypothetical protein
VTRPQIKLGRRRKIEGAARTLKDQDIWRRPSECFEGDILNAIEYLTTRAIAHMHHAMPGAGQRPAHADAGRDPTADAALVRRAAVVFDMPVGAVEQNAQ